jgi:WD40 repeat protein
MTDSGMLRGKPSDYIMTALRGHKEHITDLAFSGDLIMTGSHDGGLTFWLPGPDEDYISHMFEVHAAPIKSCRLEVAEKRAISLSEDGRIVIWDITTLPDAVTVAAELQTDLEIGLLSLHPRLNTLVLTGMRNFEAWLEVIKIDTRDKLVSHQMSQMLNATGSTNLSCTSVASENNDVVYCGHQNGSVSLWKLKQS